MHGKYIFFWKFHLADTPKIENTLSTYLETYLNVFLASSKNIKEIRDLLFTSTSPLFEHIPQKRQRNTECNKFAKI